MDIGEIYKIALTARDDFENKKCDLILLGRLYSEYSPNIINIESFILHANLIFPKGNCGLASLYLKNKLSIGDVIRGRYLEEEHTFLLLKDSTIVDITSDQFGGPKVYVGPLKDPWRLE